MKSFDLFGEMFGPKFKQEMKKLANREGRFMKQLDKFYEQDHSYIFETPKPPCFDEWSSMCKNCVASQNIKVCKN